MSDRDTPHEHLELEPVSPELALVCPELAARLYATLPMPGDPFWRSTDETGSPLDEPLTAAFEPPLRAYATRRSAVAAGARWTLTRVATLALSGLAIAVAVAAVAVVSQWVHVTRPSLSAAPEPVETVTRTVVRTVTTPAPAPPAPKPRPALLHVPTLRWAPVAGVAYYDVAVYRGATKIFDLLPVSPEITIPPQWRYHGRLHRLTTGTYRCMVRPAFASNGRARLGTPTVQAVLAVTQTEGG